MRLTKLFEPPLEFGTAIRHVDIRFGLMDNGPIDFGTEDAPTRVRVGIVGSAETVEGTAYWLERCAEGLPPKESRQPNLFPPFPGLGVDGAFRCDFVTAEELQRTIPSRELARLVAIVGQAEVTKAIVASFAQEIASLAERNAPPHVVLVALPMEIIERTFNARSITAEGDIDVDADDVEKAPGESDLDFRGMLKAACMKLRIPIQIMWPTVYDPSLAIARKLKIESTRKVQDDATRAWNMLTALYYKAGGLPWRLARDSRQFKTSFVGLSFYRSVDGSEVHTSTAQMFDERGEGLVLRGGRAVESAEDRRPHMTAEDAFHLMETSLKVFKQVHGHPPARVVVHKTSKFDRGEIDGINKALDALAIDRADLIAVSKAGTRFYRDGAYPPLRGTYLQLDRDQALLYTRGSVDFFRTYPGMYIPRPLLLRCQALAQPLQSVAEEVLALTKMNWNNTQFDNAMPITVAAARQVGEVLKYVAEGQEIAPRYSFYM
jgi:hypothetical protein